MNIRQFEQVIAIVEFNSIGKAAEELNMAQSTLSTSISNMEDYLGEKIFDRNNRGVTLTSFGKEVYNEARLICDQMENIKASARKSSARRSTLSVSNGYTLVGHDAFTELYKKQNSKKVKFSMKDCSIDEAIRNVISGFSEIGLVKVINESKDVYLRNFRNRGIEFHSITNKKVCVVIGEKHPLYNIENNYLRLEDLTEYPFAVFQDEEGAFSYKTYFGDNQRGSGNIALGNIGHLMNVIRNTDAFTLDVVKEKGADSSWYEGVRYIPLVEPELLCELGYIKRENEELSPLAEDYVELVTDMIDRWWKK